MAAMFLILFGDPGPPILPTELPPPFLELPLVSSPFGGIRETNLVRSSAWLARCAAAELKMAARSRTLTSSSTSPPGQLARDDRVGVLAGKFKLQLRLIRILVLQLTCAAGSC